jgi:hypothetical protein
MRCNTEHNLRFWEGIRQDKDRLAVFCKMRSCFECQHVALGIAYRDVAVWALKCSRYWSKAEKRGRDYKVDLT